MKEFLGDLDPNNYNYRNSLFGQFNNQLIYNEKKFKQTKEMEKRIEINLENINLWNKFSQDSEKFLSSVKFKIKSGNENQ